MNRALLGLFITRRRRELNVTQTALAKAAGRSQAWLSKVESGRLDIGLVEAYRMAWILKVGLDTLIHQLEREPTSEEREILRKIPKMRKGRYKLIDSARIGKSKT